MIGISRERFRQALLTELFGEEGFDRYEKLRKQNAKGGKFLLKNTKIGVDLDEALKEIRKLDPNITIGEVTDAAREVTRRKADLSPGAKTVARIKQQG